MKKKIISLLCFLAIPLASTLAQKNLPQAIGNFVGYTKENNSVLLDAGNAKVMITAYTPEIVRIRMTKSSFLPDFSYAVIKSPEASFEIEDKGNDLWLSTGKMYVKVSKNPFRIGFYNNNKECIHEDYSDFGYSWIGNNVTLDMKLFKDEKFIGLGEKTGGLNRRGSTFVNWNSDVPAYGTNADPIYASIPFYIGMHSQKDVYGLFLDNSYKTTFNMGGSTDDKFTSITIPDGEMNYYFIGGSNVAGIINNYTALTGRAKLPPLWSLGYQQCRWSYFPDKEVMNIASTFREKSIPCDVIYLDINYMDNYKVFTFSPQNFPQPAEMVKKLKDMGFHVVCIIDPGLKIEEGYPAYDEGVKNNYFVKLPDGKDYVGEVWPGRSHFPDFTNPVVRKWWGKMFSAYTDKGIDGFWNDMNEPSAWGQSIPDMVEFNFDGHKTTMLEAHNLFGMQMARSTYEGARDQMNGGRPLTITRATYAGGQRYTTIWTGDNFASDEHMLLGTRLVNSLGVSGFPFAGPDIGGFIGIPSRELITRWLSLAVYTPFMRNHSDYGNLHREPWVFGKDWENIQREMINQRYKLLPYIYSTFKEATETGMPACRTLAIDYTFDENIYKNDYENEYLFGDNFLVCPVSSKQEISKVYLPEGNWYRLSNDEFFTGKKSCLVESPISELPVFVKAGAIVPMQSVAQFTAQKTDETLIVHIYNGNEQSKYSYYEDDGLTYSFEKGAYYKRLISFNSQKKSIEFGQKEGTYASKFKKLKLVLHGFDAKLQPVVNHKSVKLTKEGNTQVFDTVLDDQKIVIDL
jgi:alpha-glucosidase